jgi:hypothetical protein
MRIIRSSKRGAQEFRRLQALSSITGQLVDNSGSFDRMVNSQTPDGEALRQFINGPSPRPASRAMRKLMRKGSVL